MTGLVEDKDLWKLPGGSTIFATRKAWDKSNPDPMKGMQKGSPGFSTFKSPGGGKRTGNRPKNRKYPSKARTPLGG